MERILVCSDIHRCKENFEEALTYMCPDRIIICGDIEGYPEDYIAMAEMTPIVMVQGNCDYYLGSDLPMIVDFKLEGKHLLITHGHLFGVGGGKPRRLLEEAKARGANLVLFGHTHHMLDESWDGVRFLNPGALRGDPASGHCTFLLLTLDEATGKEEVKFYHL